MMLRFSQIFSYTYSSTFHINNQKRAKKKWNPKEKTEKCSNAVSIVVDFLDGRLSGKDSFAFKFVWDYNIRTIGPEFGI